MSNRINVSTNVITTPVSSVSPGACNVMWCKAVKFGSKVCQIGPKWDKSSSLSDLNGTEIWSAKDPDLSILGAIWHTFVPNCTPVAWCHLHYFDTQTIVVNCWNYVTIQQLLFTFECHITFNLWIQWFHEFRYNSAI